MSSASPARRGHRWFAATYDVINAPGERHLARYRRWLAGEAQGRVLEIGAGTGANFAYYASTGTMVAATEPDPFMLRRARRRAREVGAPVALFQATAEHLPFVDSSFDAVVVTLVLCTVEDPAEVLAEARRVLRTGGTLRFLEHVRADGWIGQLQDAIVPVWRRLATGCHPNRRTAEAIRAAGFSIRRLEQERLPTGAPLLAGLAAT